MITIEDPVEYHLPRLTQVSVQPAQGLGFAEALRATLRQDPDVILVGEIRDEETAQIAFKAALTGHLVLATLHTNCDSPLHGTICRILSWASHISQTFIQLSDAIVTR